MLNHSTPEYPMQKNVETNQLMWQKIGESQRTIIAIALKLDLIILMYTIILAIIERYTVEIQQ